MLSLLLPSFLAGAFALIAIIKMCDRLFPGNATAITRPGVWMGYLQAICLLAFLVLAMGSACFYTDWACSSRPGADAKALLAILALPAGMFFGSLVVYVRPSGAGEAR